MNINHEISINARFAMLSLVIAISMIACTREPSREIAQSIKSPDGKIEAVLTTRATDATVSTPYEVFLRSGTDALDEPVLLGDSFESPTLVWKNDQLLELHYTKGRIFSFRNFWQAGNGLNANRIVEIRLQPSKEGFSLSRH